MVSPDTLAVVRMDQAHGVVIEGRESPGLDAVEAIELGRPRNLAGAEVPVPASDAGEPLRLAQMELALLERLVDLDDLGDIHLVLADPLAQRAVRGREV